MPLTGFEDYNREMKQFEKSSLFQKHYDRLLVGLRKKTVALPVKSKAIEYALGIQGTQVRKLINHARRDGEPIGSTNDGYFFAKNFSEIQGTILQLEERGREILFIASRLKKTDKFKTQQSLTF